MGVRGLTTYIAKNSDRYLQTHYLHDSYLVIDGNNLAVQIYKRKKSYDCFGGDYDAYARAIREFFDNLKKCNITPLVIFDGCYENRKLRTIISRFKSRLTAARHLNAGTEGSMQVFPLFLRELFTEVVIKLGCKTLRCDFEADYDMACMARSLNCPVLSYDSDFYIFDVLYIPFPTMDSQPRRIKVDDKHIYTMECKLYKIDNFLNSLGGMDKSNLPLLAVLLGNDYIKISVFSNFYKQLKLVTRKANQNDQQRRIETVIRWLRKETYESAAKKILGRVKMGLRPKVATRLKAVADGYICKKSKLLSAIGVEASVEETPTRQNIDIDVNTLEPCEDNDSNTEDDLMDNKSEDEETSEEDDADGLDTLSNKFPEWFLKEYRSCNFPAWFVDIALHNRYFLIPQVENYQQTFAHHITLDVISAMHKILTSGTKPTLNYLTRDEKAQMKSCHLDITTTNVPTLSEVEKWEQDKRKDILLQVLNLQEENVNLSKYPADWHIFVLSIIYWVKNSEVKISNIHVYALIMCVILLKLVDNKIGYCRTLKQAHKLDKKLSSEATENETDENDISKRHCVNYIKELIPYFYMDEKMYRNPRLFDIAIIDSFSRFQSCLYHIKYLNKVLNLPLEDILVSDFYNGTFVYGVYSTLHKRTDPLSYINNLLSDAKGILDYFTKVSGTILEGLETVANSSGKKRRKRKTRVKSSDSNDSKQQCVADEEEDIELDENNQYSILNFVK